ncbi:hypothetical protein AB0C27_55875 [Nonomuraea sp. NPDC048882]|uniref:hypothetical protein n=1 Tax=Nonomuraea sp. NPDC048882 TaxID=3154347 RepID=UPI0033F93F17
MTSPPTALDEVREALAWDPDRPWWSERDVLDAVVAADEVAGWLADPRPYNTGKHRAAWAGAIDDLIDSLSRLGPHAQKALADELAATRAALAGFPGQADRPDRAPAQTAVETLRRRWNDPLVWEAAWRDLLDACRDDGTSYDVLAARRDLLWRLAASTQRPPLDLSERLSSVLDRSPCAVPQARLRLGESTAALPGAETEPDAHPEVSEEELLELCRRLLLQPPTGRKTHELDVNLADCDCSSDGGFLTALPHGGTESGKVHRPGMAVGSRRYRLGFPHHSAADGDSFIQSGTSLPVTAWNSSDTPVRSDAYARRRR